MTKEEQAPRTPDELRGDAAKLRAAVGGRDPGDPGVDRALTTAQRLEELARQAELSEAESAAYAGNHAPVEQPAAKTSKPK